MRIWLISDTHFGEQPRRRQTMSGMTAGELDDRIESNWRDNVLPEDELWHLGDVGKDWRRLERLPGIKHLILAHSSDRRPALRNVFKSVAEHGHLSHAGRSFFLVHNPDQPRLGPTTDVIHGHHHYRRAEEGHFSACVDHHDWGPVLLSKLVA